MEIDNSVSVHHRNKQGLATELDKFLNGLSPKLVSDSFKANSMAVYNTKSRQSFYSRSFRAVLHGTESPSIMETKIFEIGPNDIKNISEIRAFNKATK